MVQVDVILASYNHRQFIERTIDSILANDSSVPLHLWIIDDGSTDGSVEFLKNLDDKRISVGFHTRNMGACVAMNRAISMGKAPYIALCNSDDTWSKDKLAKQLAAVGGRDDIVSFTLASYIDDYDNILPDGLGPYKPTTFQAKPDWDRYDWLRLLARGGNMLCAPSFLGSRALVSQVGEFDNRYRQIHDMDMWSRLFQIADPVVVPEPLVQFRLQLDGGNTSAANKESNARLKFEYLMMARKFYKTVPHDTLIKIFKAKLASPNLSPFDVKIRIMMATKIPRIQAVALEMLSDNLETGREASRMTAINLQEYASRFSGC